MKKTNNELATLLAEITHKTQQEYRATGKELTSDNLSMLHIGFAEALKIAGKTEEDIADIVKVAGEELETLNA